MDTKTKLIDSRKRLLRVVVVWFVIFLGLFPWAQDLYTILLRPFLDHLPKNITVAAYQAGLPFFVPVKAVMLTALILTLPLTVHQVLSHVMHGPYQHEKPLIAALSVSSLFLFVLGMSVAYFQYFPVVLGSIMENLPEVMALDLNKYFNFVITVSIAFGIIFQMPLVIIALFLGGMVRVSQFKTARPYVIIGALIISGISFPTTMLALQPALKSVALLWLLFELGVFASASLATRQRNI